MKKNIILWMSIVLMLTFTGCSSDNDEIVSSSGLIGKWRFVEMQDGPIGVTQPSPHTINIKDFDEPSKTTGAYGGTIIYSYDNGESRVVRWDTPENENSYYTDLPVILIEGYNEQSGYYQTPFSCEVGSTTLKLHFIGFYTTDHIPETYVYKRIK